MAGEPYGATDLPSLADQGIAAGWPDATIATLHETDGPSDQPRVTVVPNGPYIVTGPVAVQDYLGCPLDLDPVAALCRCGQSAVKPNCDAACIRTGFDDAKDPQRVPDRRDTAVGEQLTVFDNRGICQHSGLCTDRLPSVFHSRSEPFVTASGGRMDEIIRAVRDCPSGALSYAMDDVESRAQVDWNGSREPTILVSKDGPYRLTGSVEVVDETGAPVERAEGASSEHCALCRCGHSQNKPFCSGMHWYVDFSDPLFPEGTIPSIFEWAGGYPALLRLTRLFYERYVPEDELLAPLFADMSADHPQRVARWLGEVFGGPSAYSDTYGGYPRMLSQHRGKGLNEEQRARWAQLLIRSAFDAGLPNDAEFRSAFSSYIEWGSRLAVENSQVDSRPPEHMPMPHWDWSTAAGPPGGRISALAPDEPEQGVAVVLPDADEPVRWSDHVKPLFREKDRRSMLFAFDLWSEDDARRNGPAILERLRAGTMPCDGAWPEDWIAVFARWADQSSQSS